MEGVVEGGIEEFVGEERVLFGGEVAEVFAAEAEFAEGEAGFHEVAFRDPGAPVGGGAEAGVGEVRVGPDVVEEAGRDAGGGDEPQGVVGGGKGGRRRRRGRR
jgi:hypothetical protein